MTPNWDDISKSLANGSLPRRETLKQLGLAVTATLLGPLGIEYARAGHHPKPQKPPKPQDPCKAFCTCRNGKQKDQCLKACKACGSTPSRLGGTCGNYFCCGVGQVSCGDYCADLASDPYNCGDCGYECDPPGPNEEGACLEGYCVYACVEGAVDCNGACTFLAWNPNHCGACGNACGGSTPYCNNGVCSACADGEVLCNGSCVGILHDPFNCGACGVVCGSGESCIWGTCLIEDVCTPDHPYWPNC